MIKVNKTMIVDPKTFEGVDEPMYILEETPLRRNLGLVADVARRAGVDIILAFKAFAQWRAFPIFREYIDSTTASSLGEARLAFEEFGAPAHTFSPAYTDREIDDMFGSDNDIELEASNEIKNLVKGWRKDTDRILHGNASFFERLYNVAEVFVLGHSMADVDMPYFQRIKDCVQPGAVWTMSVYDKGDRLRKLQAANELQLPATDFQFIRLEDLTDQGRLDF